MRVDCNIPNLIILENRWDLYKKNDAILRQDFQIYTTNKTSTALSSTNLLIGSKQELFIEEGAHIEGATLNTSQGPIYIGKNVEIMEGSMLRGPLAILDGAVVKMGSKIYGATTIGPACRIGGEVSNSIFQAFSNKSHDGFLGSALIGEWCNLGADTNCSNLKNNYGKVSTYSYEQQQQISTTEIFMGLTMGDHSKSAINVQFNTASVVGVSSNIFCSNFPQKFIPSFQWVSDEQTSTFLLDKAIEAASAMMARRAQVFSQHDTTIFNFLAKNWLFCSFLGFGMYLDTPPIWNISIMSILFDQDFFGLSNYDTDAEFIPLITAEEEEHMNKQEFPEELPIFAFAQQRAFSGGCYSNYSRKRQEH